MNCQFFIKTSFPIDKGFHNQADRINVRPVEIGSGCSPNIKIKGSLEITILCLTIFKK